jgi:hypothetical protein
VKVIPRIALVGFLVVIGWVMPVRAGDYSENFDSYSDGALPTGWQYLLGPGRMAVTQGRFSQVTTTFSNYCYYGYVPQVFGSAVYKMTVNVSNVAYNTMVIWRADLGTYTGAFNSLELVFNTSQYLPPIGHTKLLLCLNGTQTVIADTAYAYPGVHVLVIDDLGERVVLTVDGAPLFNVAVSPALPPGHIVLNPGDWGSGSWYDDFEVTDQAPTPVARQTWGALKARYR